ncbi:MAG: hypothetical protein K8R86_05540 [Bacteroidales bacterium]|nr:hypothetical protein [Bacteroidales bacterium]
MAKVNYTQDLPAGFVPDRKKITRYLFLSTELIQFVGWKQTCLFGRSKQIIMMGKTFSFQSLRKMFNLGATSTIIEYISFLEDSFLLFTIPKFGYSGLL